MRFKKEFTPGGQLQSAVLKQESARQTNAVNRFYDVYVGILVSLLAVVWTRSGEPLTPSVNYFDTYAIHNKG